MNKNTRHLINFISPRIIATPEDKAAASEIYHYLFNEIKKNIKEQIEIPSEYTIYITNSKEIKNKNYEKNINIEIKELEDVENNIVSIYHNSMKKVLYNDKVIKYLCYAILVILYHEINKDIFSKTSKLKSRLPFEYKVHYIKLDDFVCIEIRSDTLNKMYDYRDIEKHIEEL
jgi:hypothetical protein